MSARKETIEEALAAERLLADDLANYAGQWVAVSGHRVVAHEETLAMLLETIDQFPGAAVFRVTEGPCFYASRGAA